AVARADDHVRDRHDVNHRVQGFRHGGCDDPRGSDGLVGGAALRHLSRGLPVFPHGIRSGTDTRVPRVRAAVLDPADVRSRAPRALLNAMPTLPHPDGSATAPLTPLSATARRIATLFVVHAILITGAVFILLPFVWMLVTSIKSPAEIFAVDFSLWPKHFSAVQNYGFALGKFPLLRF